MVGKMQGSKRKKNKNLAQSNKRKRHDPNHNIKRIRVTNINLKSQTLSLWIYISYKDNLILCLDMYF